MKKVVKFLSFAFLSSFLVIAEASASGGTNSNTEVKASENSIREQLVSTLSRVDFEDGNEVYVYFTVSSEKGFVLNNVSGQNSELTEAVKKTLGTRSISAPSNLEGKYRIKVRFTDISSL